MVRDYLQVGGNYVENAAGEHVWENQVYVEHLVPVNGSTQPFPLVMIHGSAQTATVSGLFHGSVDLKAQLIIEKELAEQA